MHASACMQECKNGQHRHLIVSKHPNPTNHPPPGRKVVGWAPDWGGAERNGPQHSGTKCVQGCGRTTKMQPSAWERAVETLSMGTMFG
eukprot:363049-Chlamydomonas_euryale.AAC.18